jgi:hypothetical protein
LLHDQGSRCDHREVLISLVCQLVRGLLGLLAVLVRADLSKDVELLVLRHENQVLRRTRPEHGRCSRPATWSWIWVTVSPGCGW